MPIYEYRCDACGREIEVLQKMSAPALLDCTACGKPALRKLMSAAGFQLKGTGWYATDFKATPKANGNAESAGKEESKDSTKKDESKKEDAKPAQSVDTQAAATKSGETKASANKPDAPDSSAST